MANFNFNKVILGGRITADPELRQTPQGVTVSTFSLAVNHKKEGTDFFNCVAWRGTAEFITKYFKKGSSICVIGTLQNRSWTDNNNNKRSITEVVVDEANFVDSASENKPTFASAPMEAPNFEELSNDDNLPF